MRAEESALWDHYSCGGKNRDQFPYLLDFDLLVLALVLGLDLNLHGVSREPTILETKGLKRYTTTLAETHTFSCSTRRSFSMLNSSSAERMHGQCFQAKHAEMQRKHGLI